MSSSSMNHVSLMDSMITHPQAETAVAKCSVNTCCSHSIAFPRLHSLAYIPIVALSFFSNLSLVVFPVIDHDLNHCQQMW